MNAKYLIVAMIETIIKIAILAAVVVFVFRGRPRPMILATGYLQTSPYPFRAEGRSP